MLNNNGNFLIYYDSYKRDYLSCNIIKNFLKKKGHKVYITSRLNLSFFINFMKFDYFIVINNIFSPIKSKILKKVKSKIILIDSEGAMTEEWIQWLLFKDVNRFQRIKKMKFAFAHCEKIFVWNNYIKNFLLNESICDEDDKLIVKGSFKLSVMNILNKKNKVNSKKNTIGIITRFLSTNDFNKRTTLQNIVKRFINTNIDDQFYYSEGEIQSIYIFLELIDNIIKYTDFSISIKPHPNEYYAAWKDLLEKYPERIFLCDPKDDLIEWILDKEQIICTPSTSLVEAIVANKKIISIHKLFRTDHKRIFFENSLTGLLKNMFQILLMK